MKAKEALTKICHFDSESGNAKGSRTVRKGNKNGYRDKGSMKVATRRKKRSIAKISMKFETSEGKVLVDLPIKTVSEANCFEHWQVKHGRHKEQQRIVALGFNSVRDKIKLPCKIMLTRLAPDELDTFDNLPMSFKYIVDAICAIITGEYRAGKADSDKRISIACDQVKSTEYGVRVEVTY